MCVNKDNNYLDEAVNSILCQTFSEFEFIIVANNCDDDLYKKLSDYKDNRIRLFRTKIGQLAFNLNYGVNESIYDYIVRMDSDDISHPKRLEILKETIECNPSNFYCFSYDVIDTNNNVLRKVSMLGGPVNMDSLFFSNKICHPTVAFNKNKFFELRGYSGGFQSEDMDLWFRLNRADITIYSSVESVLKYRIHPQQSKGNILPYCEVSGYILRELLLDFSIKKLLALIISIGKRIVKPYK